MLGHRRCVCFTGANAIEGLGTDDLEAGLLDVCWVVTGVGGKQAFIIYIYTCYICIYHMYIYNTCIYIYIAARRYISHKKQSYKSGSIMDGQRAFFQTHEVLIE